MNFANDNGQATVLTTLALVVLLGMAALVLDIGSWYRAAARRQSTADAAALAGAQALPYGPGPRDTLALQYVTKNGGGARRSAHDHVQRSPNDTIKVNVTSPAPGFFTKLFGVRTSPSGRTRPRARASGRGEYVAPIGVQGPTRCSTGHGTCPCFGRTT